jgi:hypothetical protein
VPAGLGELQVVTDLDAQRADGVVHDLGGVGAEENQIAILSAGARHDAVDGIVAEELENRRLQAIAALRLLVDLHIREALGAVASDERRVIVDLFA